MDEMQELIDEYLLHMDTISKKAAKRRKRIAGIYRDMERRVDTVSPMPVDDDYAEEQIALATGN